MIGNTIIQDMGYIYPEIALTLAILTIIIVELIPGKNRMIIPAISVAGLLISIYLLTGMLSESQSFAFSGMLIIDNFGTFFKILFAVATIFIVFLSYSTFSRSGEYYVLILGAVLGMFFMASASHIAMIAMSLEIVGITCYVLAGYRKFEIRSSEASLKYMLFGAMSTGVMLYGFSFLYGMTGSVNIYAFRDALLMTSGHDSLMLLIAVLFVLAGIGYKIAIVPFHFWCPDVYEGAPTPVTTFFSVVPKLAGIALMTRFLFGGLSEQLGSAVESWAAFGNFDLPLLLAALSAITMTVGNFSALAQSNIKRLLAYSSIAHAGYIMMGFALFNGEGIKAIMFYSIVYMFMNFGAFTIVDAIALKIKSENISDYAGIGKRAPFFAAAMVVFLVALTGLPPTAGFIGKLMLFSAVINGKMYWLALVAALNSVVSLYYYFRIARAMYFESSEETAVLSFSKVHVTLVAIFLVSTIYFGLFFNPLFDWTGFGLSFSAALP